MFICKNIYVFTIKKDINILNVNATGQKYHNSHAKHRREVH